MSSSEVIESERQNAEIYHGDEVCKQKCLEWLDEICLPKGVLPVPIFEIVEFGRNRSTGYVWIKLKNKIKEHKFKPINRAVSYDSEITCYSEERRLKKVTGIKSKEMFIWITVSDIYIEDPSSGKIFFAIPSGMRGDFPVSAFEPEDVKSNIDDKKNSRNSANNSKLTN
ncbi:hypothetical protein COLO4_31076 [Corchorus olitorius]|uniref:DUF538 domain-containing protein n=1 Tax=Corchorus olitorius TaxID=93759 RepID=A0A1R3H5R6_9ROSI|nr:hypothetical protein COLO4_31076 [Corchorus olitorius]